MRRKRTYIQKSLFFDDEEINLRKKVSKQYDQYTQGAVDMFLQMIASINKVEQGKYRKQMLIRHLPRKFMEPFILKSIKDKKTLIRFLSGEKVTFRIEMDDCGTQRDIKVNLKP